MKQELYIPKERRPEGGSYFDDLLGAKPPTDEELNSAAVRAEINARPGVCLYVAHETLTKAREVVALWQRYDLVNRNLRVLIDDTLPPHKLQVRYPNG